jgi:hypothetical protein
MTGDPYQALPPAGRRGRSSVLELTPQGKSLLTEAAAAFDEELQLWS